MTARATAGRDRGDTLVELLVTVAVLGLGATAVLGGLMVAIGSSTFTRSQSGVQALLRSYADALSDVGDAAGTGPYPYTQCAKAADFPAPGGVPGLTVPSGWSLSIQSVTYWNASSAGFRTTANGGGCNGSSDIGIQRLTLTATAPAGLYPSLTRTLDVVVRRPCATAAAC